MNIEMAAPCAKKRRDGYMLMKKSLPASELEESHSQELLLNAGEEEDKVDHINRLPNEILCDIISLLPTKDGARTQILASRWRYLWLSVPLNLDANQTKSLTSHISKVLAAHPGPGRRFSIPLFQLRFDTAQVNSWFQSPALDNLQELEFKSMPFDIKLPVSLPASTFRFSATLQIFKISTCIIEEGQFKSLCFPRLRQLGLEAVHIPDVALHNLIEGCPVLECLQLNENYGFNRIQINSPTLTSIRVTMRCLEKYPLELIIEDAPSLERLLPHEFCFNQVNITIMSAPKLEILGVLSDRHPLSKFAFGTIIVTQALHVVSFTNVVSSVRTLAIENCKLDLDIAINLMNFFPCIEKLYVKTSCRLGKQNLWRRKHRDVAWSLDIPLKTIVLKKYRGTKSHVNFATFFIQNAKMLELMRFEGASNKEDCDFIAEQHRLLQLDKRASRGARFHFTCKTCDNLIDVDHVN